jgi:hypothetical protein
MRPLFLVTLLAAALTGCGDRDDASHGVRQTKLPGDITAGGRTSGQVMAANGTPATAQPGPAGTPGIPKGAEGNTGGTAMGGTTPSAPAAGAAAPTGPASAAGAPASAALAPASAASAPAMSDAQRQQMQLVASMDTVAARWRARAAAQGWPVHPPTPVESAGGIQASATPPATGAQAPIKSEKLGTAAPSADVKQATKPQTDDDVNSKHPKAAGSKP